MSDPITHGGSPSLERRPDVSGTRSARPLQLNARCLVRAEPTGVDQLTVALAGRAGELGVDVIEPAVSGRIASNVWEQVVLPWHARRAMLMSLANSGPVIAGRHVVMIHDAAHWDHPEWFSRPYRAKAHVLNRIWARRSELVLVPSQFTADRLTRHLPVEPDRLRVVGNAHRWPAGVPRRVRTDERFVLTVSTLSTRKNVRRLVAAWPHVRAAVPGVRLKVVGTSSGSILAGDGDHGAAEGVDFLGYVSETSLDELFLAASGYASASLYEGFNIPVLDAIVAGVPVAISDIAVHRELYGEVASFFDPTSVDDIARSVVEALELTVRTAQVDHYLAEFDERAVVDRVVAEATDVMRSSM